MCPACIGSALIAFTSAGSAGGLALLASKALGKRRLDPRSSAHGAGEPASQQEAPPKPDEDRRDP